VCGGAPYPCMNWKAASGPGVNAQTEGLRYSLILSSRHGLSFYNAPHYFIDSLV
jgi:hypothetical protein